MKRGQSKRLMLVLLATTALVVAAAAGLAGSKGGTAQAAAVEAEAGGSGILRIGTTSYVDSFNPWNYIEGQGLNAMIMVYPLLVQVDYSKAKGYYIAGDWAKSWKPSKGGKTWTFKLRPGAKWSDGRPMTAADAAWTINTTIKYAAGATAVQATALNHAKNATAPNSTTLVVNYEAPVGNALWLICGHADRAEARLGAVREEAVGRQGDRRRTGRKGSCPWSPAAPTR